MRRLVVEDEEGIAAFLKQGLLEESYMVDVANDGQKGLQLALSGDYNLLLLDWMLPGLSGIEICRRFRIDFPETPIIFLTAKDKVDETIFGLQLGANDFIKKPFHFNELLERIKVQLRPKTGEHDQFTLGDITLNTETHEVRKNNLEYTLHKKSLHF